MRKPCADCGRLIQLGVTRCPRCKTAKDRRYARQRGSVTARGYGAEWRRIRAAVLREQPCCPCGRWATDVDHIVSRRKGGTDARGNLVGRCHRCHSRKTAREDGGFGNG